MSDSILKGYEPQSVLRIFDEITKIPRESGNEAQISQYLVDFAEKNHLEYRRDASNNVLIRKPASPGYERDKGFIFQAHMDMVCEKISSSNHDFARDPIHYVVEEDRVVAKETTLGADNGLGMSLILALLEDPTLQHPALEAVFTTDEEVGLTGAENFDSSQLRGEFLLNLDGGPEGVLTAGSAGGPTVDVSIPVEEAPVPEGSSCFSISITGLLGGHSGHFIIAQGRGNANKLLFRLLYRVAREIPLRIVSVSGGLKGNSIPREAEAVFCVPSGQAERMRGIVEALIEDYQAEYRSSDPGLTVTLQPAAETAQRAFTEPCTRNVIAFGYLCDSGVLRMCPDLEDTIESSNNLGVVSMEESAVVFRFVTRSILRSMYTDMEYRLESLAALTGGSCRKVGDCVEWEYLPNSELQKVCQEAYYSLYQKEPTILVEHVGLECGYIKKNADHPIDALSLGPNTGNYHTPGEWFSISSAARFWEFLKAILKTHTA